MLYGVVWYCAVVVLLWYWCDVVCNGAGMTVVLWYGASGVCWKAGGAYCYHLVVVSYDAGAVVVWYGVVWVYAYTSVVLVW